MEAHLSEKESRLMKKRAFPIKTYAPVLASLVLAGLSAAWITGATNAWFSSRTPRVAMNTTGTQISGSLSSARTTFSDLTSDSLYPLEVSFDNTSTMDLRVRLNVLPVWQMSDGNGGYVGTALPMDNLVVSLADTETGWTKKGDCYELDRPLKGGDRLAEIPAESLDVQLTLQTGVLGSEYDGLSVTVYLYLETESAKLAGLNP
jgi:hypothetical protein